MALLQDLRHLHHWSLQLWHGDHGWHQHSAEIAAELSTWCRSKELDIHISRAEPGQANNEASARRWRYSELQKAAETFCGDVVTAHTASDRAEGVVMNLARGCDIQGLSALRNMRLLSDEAPDGPRLRRPFLHLTREETAKICTTLQLPIWLDPSNADLAMERNRIRHQVIPVLNDLHPGCEKRIAGLSERIAQWRDTQAGLSELAVQHLSRESGLDRQKMRPLDDPTCRALLATWLKKQGTPHLSSQRLDELSHRLRTGPANGQCDLGNGWTIQWNRSTIRLHNIDAKS